MASAVLDLAAQPPGERDSSGSRRWAASRVVTRSRAAGTEARPELGTWRAASATSPPVGRATGSRSRRRSPSRRASATASHSPPRAHQLFPLVILAAILSPRRARPRRGEPRMRRGRLPRLAHMAGPGCSIGAEAVPWAPAASARAEPIRCSPASTMLTRWGPRSPSARPASATRRQVEIGRQLRAVEASAARTVSRSWAARIAVILRLGSRSRVASISSAAARRALTAELGLDRAHERSWPLPRGLPRRTRARCGGSQPRPRGAPRAARRRRARILAWMSAAWRFSGGGTRGPHARRRGQWSRLSLGRALVQLSAAAALSMLAQAGRGLNQQAPVAGLGVDDLLHPPLADHRVHLAPAAAWTDIVETLSDASLGREMHSVISQGRVEEIVHSKPRDRRLLVEEAAGLGKHRKRRRRAQLKLERTQDNLDRALDVEREARSSPAAAEAPGSGGRHPRQDRARRRRAARGAPRGRAGEATTPGLVVRRGSRREGQDRP